MFKRKKASLEKENPNRLLERVLDRDFHQIAQAWSFLQRENVLEYSQRRNILNFLMVCLHSYVRSFIPDEVSRY